MNYFAYFVAGWIFLVGLYGIVRSRNLIHMIVCLSVCQSSTYLLLLSIGYKVGARPPIFADVAPGASSVDSVVHALALTDIVVGGAVTALLLAVAVQIHKRAGSLDPDKLEFMRG